MAFGYSKSLVGYFVNFLHAMFPFAYPQNCGWNRFDPDPLNNRFHNIIDMQVHNVVKFIVFQMCLSLSLIPSEDLDQHRLD